jgi:ubiquinone/menaquinone biosynthesis C-methylase UbiE
MSVSTEMAKQQSKYTSDFILKINEIFHNIEGISYENNHPEIFSAEVNRWIRFADILFSRNTQVPIRFIDIGSGTGFVPLCIAGFLKNGDTFICSDISQEKLNICRDNISRKNFSCNFEYLKLNGLNFPLDPGSCDFISMNSVLHHIPDFATMFVEVDRILKTGGVLVVGHEPNKLFYQNNFLRFVQSMVSCIIDPRAVGVAVLRKLRFYDIVRGMVSEFDTSIKSNNEILNKVNNVLLNERLVDYPLTSSQLTEIVDIHSPKAGGNLRIEVGIDFLNLIKVHLPNYRVEHFETYNHLGYLRSRSRLISKLSLFLKDKFPNEGETFAAILRKQTA